MHCAEGVINSYPPISAMPQTEAQSEPSTQLTRYVDHPGRRRAIRSGRRNLAWGVAFLFAAVCICGIALYVGGARALLAPLLFLICFTALWVLARMKVFSQRNGVFFGLTVAVLLGASVALLEQAWFILGKRSLLGAKAGEPNVTLTPSTQDSSTATSAHPLLTRSLKYEEPDPSLPRVRASRDFDISIGGRIYSIRKGDSFQLRDEKNGEYVIVAGEFLARVPLDSMDQLTPELTQNAGARPVDDGKGAIEKAESDKIQSKARAEAVRRFPGLSQVGSSENKLFLEAYNDLKKRNSELLEDPAWPIRLAEILAQRYSWQEAGVIDVDAPPVTEPSIAPGTKMLSEPGDLFDTKPAPPVPGATPSPAPSPAPASPAGSNLPQNDPDIPPPPRGPQ
jgi:hypothetical protein